MKVKMTIGIISFALGCALGWLITFYYDYTNFGTALKLLKEGELAMAINQANETYFSEDWAIARWELKKVNRKLEDYLHNQYGDEKYLKYELFLENARLARVYQELNDNVNFTNQVTLAITLMANSDFHPEPVTNSAMLLKVVEKIDSIENKHKGISPSLEN